MFNDPKLIQMVEGWAAELCAIIEAYENGTLEADPCPMCTSTDVEYIDSPDADTVYAECLTCGYGWMDALADARADGA